MSSHGTDVVENPRVYTPSRWVILEHPGGVHTVLGGWSGGYLDGYSWRRSTAIQRAVEATDTLPTGKSITTWEIHNLSGSIYKVAEGGYGTTSMTAALLGEMVPYGVRALTEPEMYEFLESVGGNSDST